MKKMLSFLLALVMCLSLAACGDKEASPEAVPAETLAVNPTAATYSDHPLLDEVCGEWILTDSVGKEAVLFSTMVIREDNTAIVDGEELTWSIDCVNSSAGSLFLDFYRGSEKVVSILYDKSGDFYSYTADGKMRPDVYINSAIAAANADAETMDLICGSWVMCESLYEGVPGEILLNQDHSCSIDGVLYTWISEKAGKDYRVFVMEGSSILFELLIGKEGEEYVMRYLDGDKNPPYINPKHYDIVEINGENWLDYFEFVPSISWEKNAFDEVQRLSYYGLEIVLKAEYLEKLSRMVCYGKLFTKNAMEITYSYAQQAFDVDLENQTVTPREGAYTFVERRTQEFTLAYNPLRLGVYGNYFDGHMISGSVIPYFYDFELVRADCPLYLVKDEYRD